MKTNTDKPNTPQAGHVTAWPGVTTVFHANAACDPAIYRDAFKLTDSELAALAPKKTPGGI